MSFLRHEEIYHSDVIQRGRETAALSHRCDEFPAGYSSAGCSPAEPASASPAKFSLGGPAKWNNLIASNGDVSLSLVSQSCDPPHFYFALT